MSSLCSNISKVHFKTLNFELVFISKHLRYKFTIKLNSIISYINLTMLTFIHLPINCKNFQLKEILSGKLSIQACIQVFYRIQPPLANFMMSCSTLNRATNQTTSSSYLQVTTHDPFLY